MSKTSEFITMKQHQMYPTLHQIKRIEVCLVMCEIYTGVFSVHQMRCTRQDTQRPCKSGLKQFVLTKYVWCTIEQSTKQDTQRGLQPCISRLYSSSTYVAPMCASDAIYSTDQFLKLVIKKVSTCSMPSIMLSWGVMACFSP